MAASIYDLIPRIPFGLVVKDATAAAIVPEGNGYQAALINFRFIANSVWTTEEAVEVMKKRE